MRENQNSPFAAHSPLAFKVTQSRSKKVMPRLRNNSSVVSHSKKGMQRSPSASVKRSPLGSPSRGALNKLSNTKLIQSHRGTLNTSLVLARNNNNSNRGIVTMQSRNGAMKGVQSGLIRSQSGRRRQGSTLTQKSLDNLNEMNNEASNQYYDKNLGRQYDKYK